MQVTIAVVADEVDEALALRRLVRWLEQDEDLRGATLSLDGRLDAEHMGVDVETLTAVLGPTGLGVAGLGGALFGALSTWLSTRRRTVVRVKGPGGEVEVEASMDPAERLELLRRAGEMTRPERVDEAP